MHFAKTYSVIISGLPPELRDNAIQYRPLKKLIKQTVQELSALGFSPNLLQELLDCNNHEDDHEEKVEGVDSSPRSHSRVIYKVIGDSGRIEPHLRLSFDPTIPISPSPRASTSTSTSSEVESIACEVDLHFVRTILGAVQAAFLVRNSQDENVTPHPDGGSTELIIPLAADAVFFETLSTAVGNVSAYQQTVWTDFMRDLKDLSQTISLSARPSSATATFHPHSRLTTKPWAVHSASKAKSDLYAWREIFQLYVETEVFESIHELDRGERSVEESEKRLKLFGERITQRSQDRTKWKLKTSRDALEAFLQLNIFILNIKRFQFANAEATRKILKKHTKRTSLAIPTNVVVLKSQTSLSRLLVQAIGETLLPIIPHLDDYNCLICISLAFKPIRLNCGHLFCIRCLVKMQKRGKADCPMCRSPCVLMADKNNVDWALLNFMQDWFPVEAKKKLYQNEKEAAREQLEEMGLNPDVQCTIM